ncbi:zinc finger matrin-type protein 4 isoform X3 [Haemorhous mexicanus]|uniref:zinc finger matrin-type protein 4 isoform X3 n=1 Tax=Haemorhous mexicanus TaxID=30427 RepID=UPI0028BE85CC|nr:zinc finger matrin-type protein 4 isoform X3 [Haemorhous mexicanus]
MKSSDIDQELFTESYCKVCSAQLISESQRVAHYESRKHASKVRLYYMLHPVDGGCPAKKLRSENGSDGDSVDKNKCCTLCNMSFTSAVVAESHYQGKIHAKRLKLLLGEQPALKATEAALGPLKPAHTESTAAVPPPPQRRDSDRPEAQLHLQHLQRHPELHRAVPCTPEGLQTPDQPEEPIVAHQWRRGQALMLLLWKGAGQQERKLSWTVILCGFNN